MDERELTIYTVELAGKVCASCLQDLQIGQKVVYIAGAPVHPSTCTDEPHLMEAPR